MRARGRRITAAIAALATAIGVIALAAPASAATTPGTSSIVSSALSRAMQGTGDRLGLSVQVFDRDHVPLAFSGVASFSSVLGGASPSVSISSADGAPAEVSVPTAGMTAGDFMTQGTVSTSLELTAAGDDTAWLYSTPLGNLVQFNGSAAHLDGPPEPIWWPVAQDWGCDRVVYAAYVGGSNAFTCVTNRPTTGDETWQRGYKLTFNWTPQTAPDGRLYDRCKLWFVLPSVNGAPTTSFMLGVDVPGSWTTYTVPIPSTAIQYALTPGSTALDQRVQCFDFGQDSGAEQVQSGALVPDIPPTEPTTAVASADGTEVDAVVGGSRALGVSPLEGYRASLVDANGAVVSTSVLTSSGTTASAFTSSAKKPGQVAHTFGKVKPGTYRLRVSSFNAIGASAVTQSSIVRVTGKPAVSAPRSVRAKAKSSKATITWRTPARAGSGIASYRVVVAGGKHRITRTVTGSHHSLAVTKLRHHTKYNVRVTALDRSGHTGLMKAVFRTKR